MDSRTYWRRREELFQRQDIKSDKELAKKMNDVLTETSEEIQKEIDAFYSRYATREGISLAEVNKRVAKMEVDRFAKQAKEYVKNKDFSDKANHELKIYNLKMKTSRLELLKAKVDLHLIGATSDMEGILREGAYEQALMEYERDAGILADSVQFDVEKRVQQVLDGSYSLKDSPTFKTFSDNIWLYKTELQNDLEKMLVRSFTRGENPRVMARELKKRFDVTGYQAERLARTETARLQTAIQRDSLEENGIKQYEYIAEPSACHLCSSLDGKIYKLKDMVVGENAPVRHPNCLCRISPYVSSKTMYDDWLKAGIIDKEEYQSATAFKRDYDTKFEKLMEKRNKHVQSTQSKRDDAAMKSQEMSEKFKTVLEGVDFSKSRRINAKKVLQNLGLDDIPVSVRKIKPNGFCKYGISDDGTVTMKEYVLNSEAKTSDDYKNKTIFHEAYHAMNHGRKNDRLRGIFGDIGWLDIEEAFAETSAHYAIKQAGVKVQLAPAYPEKLVNVLPRLKKLDKFKNASKLSDFGEIAWSDRLAGQSSTWEKIAKEASDIDHDWVSYGKQYSNYIKENESKLQDMMLQMLPKYDNEYVRGKMKDDLHSALDKAENGGELNGNEKMVYSHILSIAMDSIGVK